MGEDIHQKTFVKSKATGKYSSAMDVMSTWSTEYSSFRDVLSPTKFKELIPDRYYDLFSLFGSRRSDWKELDGLQYGMPEFIEEDIPLEHAYHEEVGSGYYGYCWIKLPDFKAALEKYIKELEDPALYMSGTDEWDEIMSMSKEDRKRTISNWSEGAAGLISYLKEMLSSLESLIWCKEGDNTLAKLIDIDETVFMFWFDN